MGRRKRKHEEKSADFLSLRLRVGNINSPDSEIAYCGSPHSHYTSSHTDSFGSHTIMACPYTNDVIRVVGLTAIIL